MNDYYELGEHLDWADRGELYPATAALVKACQEHPDIDFRELRFEQQGGNRTEFVVITAGDGTVAEGNPGGIRRRERLAISVNPTHRVPIVVLTLRKDFPSLSHQHARAPGKPRTLCLYEMVWSAVETRWTAERFLSRMFWWLRESAQLRLHREDQPLEQLFYMSPYQLILPANHAEYAKPAFGKLSIQRVDEGQTVTLKAVPADEACGSKSVRMIAIGVPAVDTNAVATFPETLGALHEQLVSWGSNLSTQLFESVFDAIPDGIAPSKGQGEGLLILVWVPRIRNGEVERPDVMGYMVNASLFELASAMDMLGPKNSNGVHFRVQLLDGRFGAVWESFPVFPVEIRPSLDANAARDLSAIDPQEASFQGVLAGVGALGGTLADIWVRECWGHWTFIDPDQVLPHNLSRHIAVDSYVGYRKALVVQDIAKAIYPHESPPGAIVKSIVGEGEDISEALSAAQLVVDVTTTFEVPRGLALRDNVPRTVSLFMTPSGLSSVMIMEDAHRQQRVDALEGQYYRAILNNEWGASHLANHYGDRWVGGGCRDISVRMSNECIHLHAGILSRQLRQSAVKDNARLCVWTSDELSGAVSAHEVQLFAVTSVQTGGWAVRYDQGLVQKLKETRELALPNETGGAILGVTDFKTRTIILVDVLPAPPDSEASPSHFIRGKQGQEDALEVVHQRTARVVDYVGEWHSHPPGYSARASAEDEKLLSSLHRKMSAEGLPAVMLIVSVDQINIVVL